MKVLFINQYYWPDLSATAQQLTDLAEHLSARGRDVHVLCAQGLYEEQPGRTLPRREAHNGVSIHRIRQWGSRSRGIVGRMLAYVGFDISCFLWVLFRGWRYDVVITLTEPPLIGMLGVMIRLLSFGRVKHICWSMDLYTDCMFALGITSPRKPLGFTLELLNRQELRRANATVVLGECMRQRALAKGVAPHKLHVVGVWNRADQLRPTDPGEPNPLRTQHGLDGKFIVMYSGNAGRSHSFEAICHAMRELNTDARIHFLFVGGGKRLNDVEAFAREHKLSNFTRLPYFPREQLNESLAMGDVHLVSLHPKMAGVVVPCKLYGIMGVGRPVLFVGPGQSTVAREVTQAQAGMAFEVDQGPSLVQAIRRLANDAQECRRLGDNGRRFFLSHHDMHICCAQWEAVLDAVVGPRAAPRAPLPSPVR